MNRWIILALVLVVGMPMGCRSRHQQQRGIERYQPQKRGSYQVETGREVARSRPPSYETEKAPTYERLSTGKTDADRRLAARIERRLTSDDRLASANIHVRVRKGVVTLKGGVPNELAKRRATQVSRKVRGVKDVHNRLVVADGTVRRTDDPGFVVIQPDR